ncbi:hypothetical protein JF66_08335 [Cryobacterium sp. MLB-32]|uniref:hypothetical protein n=1 Tax=Cryobacterium sp. MLB-32 TaxID=1529318 RepID=UPI0004E6EE24|nr:hypothetical protein [Cryobacterium sp. MLB-32]KFF59858.1 hypothetical protein JF66_08335 [Cryobacterium sp. MLB-32]
MTDPTRYTKEPRTYSGTAIISIGCAGLSLVCLALVPFLAFVAAVAAVVSGLVARRELKANPGMTGFGLSLAGFLLGAGIVGVKFLPVIASWLMMAAYA